MQSVNIDEKLDEIISKDARYDREAYFFVRESLVHTQKCVKRDNGNRIRHITGQELLEGIRDYALSLYGPMTMTLFSEWGLHRCEDFGEIVFNLVENSILEKTDDDNRADFGNGYDFEEAFQFPFLPAKKLRKAKTATRAKARS